MTQVNDQITPNGSLLPLAYPAAVNCHWLQRQLALLHLSAVPIVILRLLLKKSK